MHFSQNLQRKKSNRIETKMNRIEWYYQNIGKRDLLYKLYGVNIHNLPKIEKVFLNVNTKTTLVDKKKVLPLLTGLEMIAGQKMKKTYAKKSIAGFKLRKGQILGGAGSLRKNRLYSFLEKVFCIVFPKNRDFQKIHISSLAEATKIQTKKRENENLPFTRIKQGKTNINFSGYPFLLYPELENHYELFESMKGFDITIIAQSPLFLKKTSSGFESQIDSNSTASLLLSLFIPSS